jgi:NitT/TauT family transport system ATP-binding protein
MVRSLKIIRYTLILLTARNASASILLEGVGKQFPAAAGEGYTAVEGITLDVDAGKFLCIVGPSGCGKSTILHMAAGLMRPTEGAVYVFGQRLAGINRRAAYMFQQDALLPWKNVLENVILGLIFRGVSRQEAEERGRTWLGRVGLDRFAASFPYQLSGGMRRRVAMAQCWIVNPDVLLMDEPFSALDIHTRHKMEDELLRLWADSHTTVLFVTHDLEEAIALSDEVAVLSAGPGSRLVGRYAIDLPRPRNLIDIRTEPRFTELYRLIWSTLREQVLKSYSQESRALSA